jgi:hypothetical protein
MVSNLMLRRRVSDSCGLRRQSPDSTVRGNVFWYFVLIQWSAACRNKLPSGNHRRGESIRKARLTPDLIVPQVGSSFRPVGRPGKLNSVSRETKNPEKGILCYGKQG